MLSTGLHLIFLCLCIPVRDKLSDNRFRESPHQPAAASGLLCLAATEAMVSCLTILICFLCNDKLLMLWRAISHPYYTNSYQNLPQINSPGNKKLQNIALAIECKINLKQNTE